MSADAVYLVAGLALFVAVLAPTLVKRIALSAPMVLLLLGMVIGLLPMPSGWGLDPVASRKLVEHVTEVAVLVALMGVGLALDRPLNLRTWRAWSPTWRLLLVAMPLTIAAVFLLGWGVLGVAAPAALLLGACLAPTDPVLAGDVQVDGPSTAGSAAETEPDERDEVKFSLTSEAGLNDGWPSPSSTPPSTSPPEALSASGAGSGWRGTSSAGSCWAFLSARWWGGASGGWRSALPTTACA